MALVVERSLSKLPDTDIAAIIAYLRAVPSVRSAVPQRNATTPGTAIAAVEPVGASGWRQQTAHDGTDGAQLYQDACAACHGLDGNGSAGLGHPSLRRVAGVVAPEGATLVHAIADGVRRRVGDTRVLMPGFRNDLTDAQIAALANYVRTSFGGVSGDVTTGSVANILDGRIGVSWLIRNAHWLSIAAIVAVAAFLILIAVRIFGRHGRNRAA